MDTLYARVARLLKRSIERQPHESPRPAVVEPKPEPIQGTMDPEARFVNGLPGFGAADLGVPLEYNEYGFPRFKDNS